MMPAWPTREPVCFMDLDGVLVDFVGGSFKHHGKSLPMAEVRWDYMTPLGFNGPGDPTFWEKMGQKFWAKLGWTKEGQDIIALAEDVFGEENVCILTSPPKTKGAINGKIDWINANLPGYARRFAMVPHKASFADHGKVLVDDHDGNTEEFTQRGGISVTVPRPWNHLRNELDEELLINLATFELRLRRAHAMARKRMSCTCFYPTGG